MRKRLDDDCLLDGQLHPSIRERLERVRELPMPFVANLYGVERDEQGVAQLIWQFVPGIPLAEFKGDAAAWGRLAREAILAVEALHAAGIVHGTIHANNVIVDADGRIRLTHVSPLLYSDPDQDESDVILMLRDLVESRHPDSPLARILADADAGGMRLGELYARLAEPLPAAGSVSDVPVREPERVRSLVAASIVALLGIAIVVGVLWYLDWPWGGA